MPQVSSYYTNTCTLHRIVYNTYHQFHVVDDVQLMTESVIDGALLEAMLHTKQTLIQFWRYKIALQNFV